MYVRVHIDPEDVLDEFSDDDLREELASRVRRHGKTSGYAADHAIPAGVAHQALLDASDALRKAGRVDLAFKLDETRVDYIEPTMTRPTFNRFKPTTSSIGSH